MKVGINGFGRIGRVLAKLLLEVEHIDVAVINDLAPIEQMAHLFKYDSIHGILPYDISYDTTNSSLIVGNNTIVYSQERDPSNIAWGLNSVDIVIDCTGIFKTTELASKHIIAGAKKVIISAPAGSDDIPSVVLGVNDSILTGSETIISNASCTTNNAAPMVKIIDELCGIESGYITTVHSYTGDQRLHDAPHKDLRRARAAAQSIVPTTTGAAKAITKIFPHLEGLFGGCGIRVPVPDGSLTDLTCVVTKEVTVDEINSAFKRYSSGALKGIMQYTEDPIVSVDVLGNPHSCVFDAQLTSVIGRMVKVVGWYDNEYGYSNRLVDLLKRLSTD